MKAEKTVWETIRKEVTGNVAAKMPTMLTCKPECVPGMMAKLGFTMTADRVYTRGSGPFNVEYLTSNDQEAIAEAFAWCTDGCTLDEIELGSIVKLMEKQQRINATRAPAKTDLAAVAQKQRAAKIVEDDKVRAELERQASVEDELDRSEGFNCELPARPSQKRIGKATTDHAAAMATIAPVDAHSQGIAKVEPPAAQVGELRFFWNGIKVGKGKLQKCHWSFVEAHASHNGGQLPAQIAGYARPHCARFSAEVHAAFDVTNNTDSQTDYFESDTLHVVQGHPRFAGVAKGAIADLERAIKRCERNHYDGKGYVADLAKLRSLLAPQSPDCAGYKAGVAEDMARLVDFADGGAHNAVAEAVKRAAARAGVVATCTPAEVAVLADYRKAKQADRQPVKGHWHPQTGLWVRSRQQKQA